MLKFKLENLEVANTEKGGRQSWDARLSWGNCEDDNLSLIDEEDQLSLIAFGPSEEEALSNLVEKFRGMIQSVIDIDQLNDGVLTGMLKFRLEELEVTNDKQDNEQSWEVRVNWCNNEGGYSLLIAFGPSEEEATSNLVEKFRGMIRAVIDVDRLEDSEYLKKLVAGEMEC